MHFNTLKSNEFYNNNIQHKNIIFFKDKNKSQNSLFSSLNTKKEKINNVKFKYSIFNNISNNTQLVHRKPQLLKNKFMKNHLNVENKLKINNIIRYSINNNKDNKNKFYSSNQIKKNMFLNTTLKLVKENSFKFNNLYNAIKNEKKEKKLFFSQTNNKVNDDLLFKNESSNNVYKTNNKNEYNFKYLKNIKEDFINVHKKLKEFLQNDSFNKKKKVKFNTIFPISKKIYLLTKMKKDIQNVNKYSFTNSEFSPKSTISVISEPIRRTMLGNLFNGSNKNIITNSEGGIRKPNLIRSFSKPKLNVPKFRNLFNMKT